MQSYVKQNYGMQNCVMQGFAKFSTTRSDPMRFDIDADFFRIASNGIDALFFKAQSLQFQSDFVQGMFS